MVKNELIRGMKEWAFVVRGVARLKGDPESFPSTMRASPDGVVAVGGDLSTDRLLAAYRRGIFPWFTEGQPLLWHSPDPRFVLDLTRFRVPTAVRRAVRKGPFDIRMDGDFERVMHAAASVPRGAKAVRWITPEVIGAYTRLHELGFAHCAEAWSGSTLVGGLYGVALGGVWFGESMFSLASDAGNVVHTVFSEQLRAWGFRLIDCQQPSVHMARFGAESWSRQRFLAELERALSLPNRLGRWTFEPSGRPAPGASPEPLPVG